MLREFTSSKWVSSSTCLTRLAVTCQLLNDFDALADNLDELSVFEDVHIDANGQCVIYVTYRSR